VEAVVAASWTISPALATAAIRNCVQFRPPLALPTCPRTLIVSLSA
jgi:ornithine decarboxylase antizyme 1